MRAIQVRSTGGPEVLELCALPDPVPQAGEVLVRVHTAGVNFIDVYYREGKYHAPMPLTPGGEGSGYVEALGEGITDFMVGDSVAWWGPLGRYLRGLIFKVLLH
jgi:NADPH2:quinone reductase